MLSQVENESEDDGRISITIFTIHYSLLCGGMELLRYVILTAFQKSTNTTFYMTFQHSPTCMRPFIPFFNISIPLLSIPLS